MGRFSFNGPQRTAVDHGDGPLLVSAGAGSGKTRVLVERAVNALTGDGREQLEPGQILTITFTNKAADELKERVGAELRKRGRFDLATRIDEMWISTIHGMCSRVLREHALECGIDPAFALLEDSQQELLKIEAFREAIGTYGNLLGEQRDNSILSVYYYDQLHQGARTLLPYIAAGKTLEPYKETSIPEAEQLNRYAREFIDLVQQFARSYARLKAERGVVDYDDLERKTEELLRSDSTVSSYYQKKFKLVQIDEFQDTNGIQLSLIQNLTGDNLFTVGDAQQSIYKFRGADVATYQRYAQELDGHRKVSLDENYRSHPQIIAFSNATFKNASAFEDIHLPLKSSRDEQRRAEEFVLPANTPRISIDLYATSRNKKEGYTPGVDDLRAIQARKIANQIQDLVAHGVRPGDIAILLRSAKNMPTYLQELTSVGIEATISGGSGFFEEDLLEIVIAFLRVLANPHDEKALLLVLSSLMFRMSDKALYALAKSRNKEEHETLFDALARESRTPLLLTPKDEEDAQLAYGVITQGLEQLGREDLSDILAQAFEDSGLYLVFLQQGARGEQRYAYILELLQMADSFERSMGTGPAGFAESLQQQKKLGTKKPLPALPKKDNPVRIMTIHSAKGLEFPVVFVPEIERGVVNSVDLVRVDESGPTPSVSVNLPKDERPKGYEEPPRFVELKERERGEDEKEQARLLYVAVTRAQDALYISGCPPRSITTKVKNDMLGSALFETLISGKAAFPEIEEGRHLRAAFEIQLEGFDSITCHLHSVGKSSTEDRSGASTREGREERESVTEKATKTGTSQKDEPKEIKAPPLKGGEGRRSRRRAPLPERISYSGFSSYNECARRFEAERLYHVGELTLKGERVKAAAFGSAFHALAQLFAQGVDITDERLKAVALYHDVKPEEFERLGTALVRWKESQTAHDVFGCGGRLLAEAPFAIELKRDEIRIVLDGSIDLMCVEETRATIIDYKTGGATAKQADDEETLRKRYNLQADCYALVALRNGQEAVSVIFVRPEVEEDDGKGGKRLQQVEFTYSASDKTTIEQDLLGVLEDMNKGMFPPLQKYAEEICSTCPIAGTICPVGAPAIRRA